MTNEQTDAIVTTLKNVVAALRILNGNILELDKNIRGTNELIKCGIDKVDSVLQVVWKTEDFLKSLKPGLNAVLDLAGENNELLRGECAAREKIEKKRKADRERYHAKKNGGDFARNDKVKGEENEMRDLPPRPPIESKEKEEENSLSTRAREESKTEEPATEKKPKKPFVKPTIEEVAAYIKEKGYHFSAEAYWHFYESKDWMVGSNKMSKWRSACKTFEMKHLEDEKRRQRFTPSSKPKTNIVLAPTEAELASARDAI